ncbi:DUF2478 domain-containing protein [Ideonella sp. DXS29W]|uniref:DUF2478 domain-containing protein n=1 Tax=Ideonella lacteola TaxID=2984193 RepID=A0ABU9BNE7_9BURK
MQAHLTPLDAPSPAQPRAAAIVDDQLLDVGALLAQIVRQQLQAGRRVRGCLMTRTPRTETRAATMVLEEIDGGQRFLVSQPMGSGSMACRADPQGFANASEIFRRALQQKPDLIVSNRFGDLEVKRGGGFMAELLSIMAEGIPLLTTVARRNAPAWQDFTGGGALLPPDAWAVASWIDAAVAQYRSDQRDSVK